MTPLRAGVQWGRCDVVAAGLLMLSALSLLGAGGLLVWPRTARRIARYRFNIASASFRGRPFRRTLRYTQFCGVSVFAAGATMFVWSMQV